MINERIKRICETLEELHKGSFGIEIWCDKYGIQAVIVNHSREDDPIDMDNREFYRVESHGPKLVQKEGKTWCGIHSNNLEDFLTKLEEKVLEGT